MTRVTAPDDIVRIEEALRLAAVALEPFTPGAIEARMKQNDDPVTAADLAVNQVLEASLPAEGEGWLSEETADREDRLTARRVWVVDPLDGTREFVMGIPEWCVSVGLVVDGRSVAGGIMNSAVGHTVIGSVDDGVLLNGEPVGVTQRNDLRGSLVLASRSEVKRGEWSPFFSTPISVRNMGSVAYKLACVGAGLADATWTLVPKNEWDVAAGAALVAAAGGVIFGPDGESISFNRPDPLLPGFVAVGPGLEGPVRQLLADHRGSA